MNNETREERTSIANAFLESLKKEYFHSEGNLTETENGALAYRSTGEALVDLNFSVPFLRTASENEIIEKFKKAFIDNPNIAVKWLFYLMDIREGLGERKSSRIIFKKLAICYPVYIIPLISLLPEYSRWDFVVDLVGINQPLVQTIALKYIHLSLIDDTIADNPSLLAKWLPRTDATNARRRKLANIICKYIWEYESPRTEDTASLLPGDLMNILESSSPSIKSKRQYNATLKELRTKIQLLEQQMSANKWSEIEYSRVPSKANLLYRNAFLRHDEERRKQFLESVNKGETKMNASVLYPQDIVAKYSDDYDDDGNIAPNDDLEGLWKNLKNVLGENNSQTMVVIDVSGSMTWDRMGTSSVCPIDGSRGLGIYCAQQLKGAYHNKAIIFSSNPHYVEFTDGTLAENLNIINQFHDCSNTDIVKTFDLILQTAVNENLKQEDLPDNLLIISDMQFDADSFLGGEALFEGIKAKYAEHGYKLPKLIFWNVATIPNTIPVVENELGFALVSGYSVNILKMVLSNELDPYKMLLEILESPRYSLVICEIPLNKAHELH